MDRNTVNIENFNAKIQALLLAAPHDPKLILTHQAALLVKDLVAFSLPKSVPGTKVSAKVSVYRAFRPGRKGATTPDMAIYRAVRAKQKFQKRQLVQPSVLKEMVKTEIGRIGLLGAGWIGDGNPLHVQVPAIVRKQPALGSTEFYDKDGVFKITITNQVPFAAKAFKGRYLAILDTAFKKRAGVINAMLKRWVDSGQVRYSLPTHLREGVGK